MAKLTAAERNLLQHPPTPSTWLCTNHDVEFNYAGQKCKGVPNRGSTEECVFCHKKKTAKAPLLWDWYVKVCAKVKIEPGTLWKRDERGAQYIREKGGIWELRT